MLANYSQKYPLSVLQQKNTPSEVDRAVLEMYLDDDEFARVFNMSPAQFAAVPAWKRTNLKKAVGLF